MIKALKFDAFKLYKSGAIRIALLVCLLLVFLNPVVAAIRSSGAEIRLLEVMTMMTGAHEFVIIVFAAAFLSQDYYSGYIHNIYSKQNKTAYVISKVLWILIFSVAYIILEFCAYNFVFLFSSAERVVIYEKVVYVNGGEEYFYTAWDYVRCLLLRIPEMSVIGNTMLLFTVLVRNGFIVAIGALVYMIVSVPIFGLINGIVGAASFDIAEYTATGIMQKASYTAPAGLLWQALIVMSVYLAATILCSVLIYRKKQF